MTDGPGSGTRSFGPVTGCRVDIPEGTVRIEGTVELTARLEVRYLDGNAVSGSDPVEDGLVRIDHHAGTLAIRLTEPSRSGLRGLLGIDRRPRIGLDLRMPRDASLDASIVGGELRVIGCHGGQVLNTVTGSVTVVDAEGGVEVRTISGPIDVAGQGLDVQVATTSGRSRIAGIGIRHLRSRSVSGRIDVTGVLVPGGEHRLETVSGDIDLAMAGGTTVVHRTLSGRLSGDEDVRGDARSGVPTMVVGDGRAVVEAKTVSGDIRLSTRVPDPRTSGASSSSERPPTGRDPVLDALEALSRGDISVDEAGRRLEAIHG
jgi:hypothetical protein